MFKKTLLYVLVSRRAMFSLFSWVTCRSISTDGRTAFFIYTYCSVATILSRPVGIIISVKREEDMKSRDWLKHTLTYHNAQARTCSLYLVILFKPLDRSAHPNWHSPFSSLEVTHLQRGRNKKKKNFTIWWGLFLLAKTRRQRPKKIN